MNKVSLIGRVTKDLEVVNTANSCYCKFTLAVNRRKKDDGADFISCTAWSKTAEVMGQYVHKGDRVGIVGRIQTGEYTNKDGQKVYTTDIIVEELDFLENKKQEAGTNATPDNDFVTPTNTDDLPF